MFILCLVNTFENTQRLNNDTSTWTNNKEDFIQILRIYEMSIMYMTYTNPVFFFQLSNWKVHRPFGIIDPTS